VEVGRGKIAPERIGEIIAGRDRRLAGPTLPAWGLCLEWVSYDGATTASGRLDER
jgi:tRNA pseudouridine38-40 synthase